MRKQILTVLTMAGVSYSAIALAADAKNSTTPASPSLKITGLYRALAVGTAQKVRTNKGVQFMNYGNFTFNVGGVANNGLSYGVIAVLELDRSKKLQDKFGETYMYLGSDAIGSIQFGDTQGVSGIMMYDATDVMGGTGGFDGNLDRQLTVTRGVNFDQSVGYVNDGSNKATKATWMSPEVSGWQVGASYVPDSSQYGRSVTSSAVSGSGSVTPGSIPYAVNQIEGGLSFTDDMGPYTVGVYLVGVNGKAKAPRNANVVAPLNPVQSWQLGTLVDYENWQFGAGYFNNGKSYMRRNSNFTNTRGFNLAVGYGMGPVSLALGYTGTERTVTSGKAKADISSFTVDYSVADGLAVYGEASYFKFRAPSAHINSPDKFNASTDYLDRSTSSSTNNSGTAFVVGTRIVF